MGQLAVTVNLKHRTIIYLNIDAYYQVPDVKLRNSHEAEGRTRLLNRFEYERITMKDADFKEHSPNIVLA